MSFPPQAIHWCLAMRKENGKKIFSRADVVLILVVLLCSLLWLAAYRFWQPDTLQVVVEKDGNVVFSREMRALTEPVTLTVEGTSVRVYIDSEGACILSSDCHDQVCVRAGKLCRAGDAAVCLPNRVSVRITGGSDSTVDGRTG